jgi:hypothetical protein
VKRPMRARFWLEVMMAAVSAGLLVLTVVSHEWIEVIFGVDPDRGDGTLEWAITAVLLVATLFLLISARTEWRRGVPRPRRPQGSRT